VSLLKRSRTRVRRLRNTGAPSAERRGGPRLAAWSAALLSGFLLILSYPPFGLSWLAWFALAPLLAAWRAPQRGGALTLATFVAGAIWGGGLFYPLLFVEGGSLVERLSGFLLTAGTVSVFLTLYALAYSRFAARALAPWSSMLFAPALWIAMEYVLRLVAVGFSVYLGVTQWSVPTVRAVASIGGIHAVSGLVLATNALGAWALEAALARKRRFVLMPGRFSLDGAGRTSDAGRIGAALAVAGLVALWLYALPPGSGWSPRQIWSTKSAGEGPNITAPAHAPLGAQGPNTPEGTLMLILVQPGFTPFDYEQAALSSLPGHGALLDRMIALTDGALRSSFDSLPADDRPRSGRPKLVVWPETTIHIPVIPYDDLREPIEAMVKGHGAYLLAGFPRAPFEPPPNFALNDDEPTPASADGRQRNAAYLFAPDGSGRSVYDKVYVIPIAEAQYAPGSQVHPFPIEIAGSLLALGVGICSDAVEPRHALAAVRSGATSLHYLASLGRVGGLAQLERAFLSFRAVEHGVYVTQTATTGPTLVIDPAGKVVESIPTSQPGVLVASIPVATGGTMYTRLGDWPAGLAGAVLLVTGLALTLRGKGRQSGTYANRIV